MRLLKFKVCNFRSVDDSGWIDAERVTALIGVNESGKTNLLLPLWKLNPAREGEIKPTSDYPKGNYAAVREKPQKFLVYPRRVCRWESRGESGRNDWGRWRRFGYRLRR